MGHAGVTCVTSWLCHQKSIARLSVNKFIELLAKIVIEVITDQSVGESFINLFVGIV